jgi:hypothetical protein
VCEDFVVVWEDLPVGCEDLVVVVAGFFAAASAAELWSAFADATQANINNDPATINRARRI